MDARFQLPPDGFIQITPLGEFLHKQSGFMQVIDARAVREMANRFQAEAAGGPGILIDYDHFSYDTSKESRAAGWITELQNRSDGLYGKVRWSAQGEADVSNGNYLYISPVFLPADVEALGDKRIRPLRLDRAGLTNDPNIKEMKPLANRQSISAAFTMTPQQAANAIAAKAREYKNCGFPYEVAFNMACKEMPEMYAIGSRSAPSTQRPVSASTVPATLGAPTQKQDAALFTLRTHELKNRYSLSFSAAWDLAQNFFPSQLKLANRSADNGDLEELRIAAFVERYYDLVNELGPTKAFRHIVIFEKPLSPLANRSALERFQTVIADAGSYQYVETDAIITKFFDQVEELRRTRGWTYAQAWQHIKTTEKPQFLNANFWQIRKAIEPDVEPLFPRKKPTFTPEEEVAALVKQRDEEDRIRQLYMDAGLQPLETKSGLGKGQR